MTILWMLAQATTQPGGGAARPPSGGFFDPMMFGLLLAFGVFFYFAIMRPQQRERQKQQQMLGSLKRNDRVQTIGGIIGTIVEVRDTEVVLKVDEHNNVKMRFVRGAIKEVFRDPAAVAEATAKK
jgi:preprotein translocase subunit YajC